MSATRAFGVRKRVADLLAGRDDVVWQSLQALAEDALSAARLLEQRLHQGADVRRELRHTAEHADETLRFLNRHLHDTFTAPLERDDALALAAGFDRVTQVSEDIAAVLDTISDRRCPHEARRAASLLTLALESLVTALSDLAAGRPAGPALADARLRLAEGREFVRDGLREVLSARLPVERLLTLKDVYERLDAALVAARDLERVEDAVALGRRD